jgi:hypothetical protein
VIFLFFFKNPEPEVRTTFLINPAHHLFTPLVFTLTLDLLNSQHSVNEKPTLAMHASDNMAIGPKGKQCLKT